MKLSQSSASWRPGNITLTVSRLPRAPCQAAEHFWENTSQRISSYKTPKLSNRVLSSSSNQKTRLLTLSTGTTAAPGNDHCLTLYFSAVNILHWLTRASSALTILVPRRYFSRCVTLRRTPTEKSRLETRLPLSFLLLVFFTYDLDQTQCSYDPFQKQDLGFCVDVGFSVVFFWLCAFCFLSWVLHPGRFERRLYYFQLTDHVLY